MTYCKKRKRKNFNYLYYIVCLIAFGGFLNRDIIYVYRYLIVFALFVLFCVVICLAFLKSINKKKKYLKSGITEIDKMSGIEFEYLLNYYFKELGYKSHTTKASNDYGADLIIKKESEQIIIQAKRYQHKNNVGIKAIQEVLGAMNYYNINRGMVVTNSHYTKQATELAFRSKIELWDREKLMSVMTKVQSKNIIDEINKEEDYMTIKTTCPKCGLPLVERKGYRGKFYGCGGFPTCSFTRPL